MHRDEEIPALGSLEARIMRVLWRRPGEYRSVGETLELLGDDLAYTTVMTVMHRLHDKGLLRRRRAGRAYTYRATASREAYVADAMAQALRAAGDRRAALLHFIADLSPDDATVLRGLLADVDDARRQDPGARLRLAGRAGPVVTRLTEVDLAERAGVPPARIRELTELGVLVPQPGRHAYAAADARKVRLAGACQEAGLSLASIGAAIGAGRLSFAFLDLPTYDVLAEHAGQSFGEVAEQRGLPLDLLAATREALGFARPLADEPVRQDDMQVLAFVEHGLEAGLDRTVILQLLRVYGESLARVAEAEGAVYRRHFVDPLRQAGEGTSRSMELASAMAGLLIPVLEDMTVAVYHRQQEHTWLQNLVESIETVLEDEGLHHGVERPAAMCFLDISGYTRLTEERGDEAAARLAASLGTVVQASAVEHGGRPVKWLGDGAMSYFPDPAQGVRAALTMVERAHAAGLPPAHVGLAAGPIVYQDGDYFGRTVNLAARIAARAGPREVLVSEAVADGSHDRHLAFHPLGAVTLKGFLQPVALYTARAAGGIRTAGRGGSSSVR